MTAQLLADATARIDDPAMASQIYAKGFFGELAGESLVLNRFEALYLVEMDRLEVTNGRSEALDFAKVFRCANAQERGFEVRYLVYRDLRQRGYVVRPSPPPATFAVLPRGGVLHKTPARFWVVPFSEREPLSVGGLVDLLDRCQTARKSLMIALVDEESDLTYYRVRKPSPSGALRPTRLPEPATGWLVDDRVVVFDEAALAALGTDLAYGCRVGRRLELSLLEAVYLESSNQLTVRDARSARRVERAGLIRRAMKADGSLPERLAAYRALRDRALVVKTGFKYGAHFRAYPRRPEMAHARYLVQAVRQSARIPWPELAGSVRVAQGVRKQFLLGAVDAASAVRFVGLERLRP